MLQTLFFVNNYPFSVNRLVLLLTMSDASKICIECQLCCNGSMIGFIQLEKSEIERVKTIMEIEEENGLGVIIEPCKKLGCDGCTVYEDRPKQCRAFECKLLKSVEDKEVSMDNAFDIVKTIKSKRQTIEELSSAQNFNLRSNSFYFKTLEIRRIIKKEVNPSEALIHLNNELNALNELMTNYLGVSI